MDFIKFKKKIKRENRKENKLFIIRYDINKNISNTYYIRNFTFEKSKSSKMINCIQNAVIKK